MALNVEGVVDRGMHAEEALGRFSSGVARKLISGVVAHGNG